MRRLSTMLALLLTAVGQAQTVKLPTEVKVQPGRLASVVVEYDGEEVKWTTPAQLDVFREYDPDPKKVRLRLIGYEAGSYHVHAVTCKAGKLSEFATCNVVVGTPPAPVPPPDPIPPNPVPPTDPLVVALQSAWASVPASDRPLKADLATLWQVAGDSIVARRPDDPSKYIDNPATWGELLTQIRNAGATLGLGTKLEAIRKVIGAELVKSLGKNDTDPFADVDRNKASQEFKRIANALRRVN